MKKGEQQQQQQHIFVVELVSEPIIHQPRGSNLTLFKYFLTYYYYPLLFNITHQLFSIIGALCGVAGKGWGNGTKMILGIAKAKGKNTTKKKSH